MTVRQEGFHDQISEELYPEIPRKNAVAKALLSLEDMDIGEACVTAKIENRDGDIVKMNIQSGTPRISLNETLVNLKGQRPSTAYLLTCPRKERFSCANYRLWDSPTGFSSLRIHCSCRQWKAAAKKLKCSLPDYFTTVTASTATTTKAIPIPSTQFGFSSGKVRP